MDGIVKAILDIIISAVLVLNISTQTNKEIIKQPIEVEKPIMTITIDKLDIKNNIYPKNSKLNNIDKNVIIMNDSDYPDDNNGTVIIGAHSGTGEKAYFKEFDKLSIGDLIKITYKNCNYNYKIINIRKDNKDGKIKIDYENNTSRLILYTCYPHDKNNYMVVTAIKE